MEKIELQGIENSKGPTFSQDLYKIIKDFIIYTTASYSNGSIPFSELLDEAEKDLTSEFAGILPWHIMQVKIDLQERGIIRTTFDKKRKQIIAINSQIC